MLHNKCTSTRVSIWVSVTPQRFTISPWIYFPLCLAWMIFHISSTVPPVMQWQVPVVITGDGCGTTSPGCRQIWAGKIPPILTQRCYRSLGPGRFPSCDLQTLGAFSSSMGSQDFALMGKKKKAKIGWEEVPSMVRCCPWGDKWCLWLSEPLALGRFIWASQALAHKTCDKWSRGLLGMYCCAWPHKPARMCGNTGCLLGCLLVK